MKLIEILRNKFIIKIIYPVIFAIFFYVASIYNIKHSFYFHMFYFLFFCYLGLFIGFIIMVVLDKLEKKEALLHFLTKTHLLVLLLLFYIAFNRIEVYLGTTFQTIFLGAVLWIEAEIR